MTDNIRAKLKEKLYSYLEDEVLNAIDSIDLDDYDINIDMSNFSDRFQEKVQYRIDNMIDEMIDDTIDEVIDDLL